MLIDAATQSDAASLTRLINAAYLVEQFFVSGPRIAESEVTTMLERGTFLVARADTELAGCVFVEPKGAAGYLGLLSVDPARQGHGLGSLLLDAAEAALQRAGCARIDIRVVNLRRELPPFYHRRGYRDSGVEPFTDPRATQPCEFLLMSKTLQSAV